MSDEDKLFAAVDCLYAAALDGNRWRRALDLVARALGGMGATLELKAQRSGELIFFDSDGLPPEGVQQYASHYYALCPRWRAFQLLPKGEVSYDYGHITESQMCHDEFYEGFLRPFDLRYYISSILANDPANLGVITVQRTLRAGHVGANEIRAMARLAPHVNRALDLHLRLRHAFNREHGLRKALSQLRLGAILIDRQAQVLFANDVAQTSLRSSGALVVKNGALRACQPDADRRLGELLRSAVSAQAAHPPAAGTAELGTTQGSKLSVAVLPLPALPELEPFYTDRFEATPAAVVFLSEGRPSAQALVLLATAHGLTAAEQALAKALLDGQTVREHAAARGITVNTARTHLANLRGKMGARTQAELIARILGAASSALR